jgi:hypothetical protein
MPNESVSKIWSDWAALVGQGYRLADRSFRREALSAALTMTTRIERELDRILEKLAHEHYRFAFPDLVRVPPEAGVAEWISEFQSKGVYFPLSLEAWMTSIGKVNLCGTHPDWPSPAYVNSKTPLEGEPIYSDALAVEMDYDYAIYLYDEWKAPATGNGKPPFRLDIAPDHLHKANVSGGLPYQLDTEKPAVDGILLNERHCSTFMAYLQLAINWHGFPGLDYLTQQDWVRAWKAGDPP